MLFSSHISNRSRSRPTGSACTFAYFPEIPSQCITSEGVPPSWHSMCSWPHLQFKFFRQWPISEGVFSLKKHDIQQYTHSAVGFVFNPGFTLYHSAFPDPINIQSFSISTLSTSLIFRFDLVAKRVCWYIIASTFRVVQYRIIFCLSRARTDTCAGGLLKSRNASPTVRPASLL